MSTPTVVPTEAHISLVRSFIDAGWWKTAIEQTSAQLIAESEARAAEGHKAEADRCREKWTHYEKLSDQLRAEVERLKKSIQVDTPAMVALNNEILKSKDDAIARAERAEAELAAANTSIVSSLLYNTLKERLSETRDELTKELERATHYRDQWQKITAEAQSLRARVEEEMTNTAKVSNEAYLWRDRAEKAEAKAAEQARLNGKLVDALKFIADNVGKNHETELGPIYCGPFWVSEQALSAVNSAKESKQ